MNLSHYEAAPLPHYPKASRQATRLPASLPICPHLRKCGSMMKMGYMCCAPLAPSSSAGLSCRRRPCTQRTWRCKLCLYSL